jgi:hypothetical protein
MRTKTLLLTAVLAVASVAAVKADVFSVNVVGYVTKNYPVGFSIINNPLNGTNNTVATLFPNPPFFTQIYKFDPLTGYASANTFAGTWSDPSQTLSPGEGAFVNFPEAYTNTYVGEVLIGAQTNILKQGFNLVGSKVPQAATLQGTMGLTPGFFDIVYQFNAGSQTYGNANTYAGSWSEGDPTIGVAEGFFYFNNQGSDNTWARTFTP